MINTNLYYCSYSFIQGYLDNKIKKNELLEWNFAEDGGKFVSHPSLSERIPEVVGFIADFIRFEKKKYTHWDSPYYRVIPTMLVDIAYGCRIDSGFRLIQRCGRHAVDSKIDPLELARHGIFFVDEETQKIGLKLSNYVPASMRESVYETHVAVAGGRQLVACSCTCETGGSNTEERVACVHVLPILLLFSFFLAEGLAEHILLELTALINSNQRVLDDVEKAGDSFCKDIKLLMLAANEHASSDVFRASNVREMLQIFSVGTDKRKK